MVEENYPIPYWRGEPLEGKTILLYGEMGFGDEILSLRFAKPVKDLGARVIVSVRSPIVRLARGLAFVDAAKVAQLKAEGWGASQIARKLGIGRASVYRALEA